MTNNKSTKRALASSAVALLLCFAMLLGTTFAWFTDSSSSAGNTIKSGTLDIELQMYDGTDWVSAEGQTLEFAKLKTNYTGEEVLWEPGCTYELPKIRIVNKGNLSASVLVRLSNVSGDTSLLDVLTFKTKLTNSPIGKYEGSEFTAISGTADGYVLFDWALSPADVTANNGVTDYTPELTISAHMDANAGNPYQGLTLEGLSIEVVATQCAYEYDSFNKTYDENATYPAQ